MMDRWATLAKATLQRLGGDPRLESWLVNNLGALQAYRGQFTAALASFRRALALKTELLGADHFDVGLSQGNVASTLVSLGRWNEALEANAKALSVLQLRLGANDPQLANHFCNRAAALMGKAEWSEAGVEFNRCLRMYRTRPQDPNVAYALRGLAEIALHYGRSEVADPLLREALELSPGTADEYLVADVRFGLARALHWPREAGEALALARSAVATYRQGDGQAVDTRRGEIREWIEQHEPGDRSHRAGRRSRLSIARSPG